MSDSDLDAEREKKIEALIAAYLQSATPEQWHIFAATSNYDGNSKSIPWLIDNEKLDRGTAVLLYWYLGAAGCASYGTIDEVPGFQEESYRQILLIEKRVLEGFYPNANIAFDPMASEGGGPKEIDKKNVKRAIPLEMLRPSPGRQVDHRDDAYDDGLPLEVCEKISALFDEG